MPVRARLRSTLQPCNLANLQPHDPTHDLAGEPILRGARPCDRWRRFKRVVASEGGIRMPMPKGWKKHGGYDWKAFGGWMRASREAVGWTLSQLGDTLHIANKGTVARIESGGQGLSPDQRERVVSVLTEALAPDPARPSRRELIKAAGLKLAGLELAQSLIAPELAGTSARQARAVEQDKRAAHERAVFEECISALGGTLTATWDADLLQGHARLVAEQAEIPYRMLVMSPFLGDKDIALPAIRIGIRWARAQETVLNWFKRSAMAIATYTDIEERIILRYADHLKGQRDILREHAQLLALRASLYRETGAYRESVKDLRQSIALAQRLKDPLLHVDGFCELAHVWLCCGNQDQWERTLDHAREAARFAPVGQQPGLFALVGYYEGAGQRRLAFDEVFGLSEDEKIEQATRALGAMRSSRQQLGDDWSKYVLQGNSAGHPLVTRVSEAQCYIWTEPERVAHELESLKPLIKAEFPGLMGKITVAEPWPAIRLNWNKHNGLPFFDLSGRRDASGRMKPRFRA